MAMEEKRVLSLVSNKSKKVFLSTNTKIATTNKVDIILSPEFYWVRVFDIPVKNISQARHVLPTLFEDILETVNQLSYEIIKLEDNRYLCFAYINKKIYEAIKLSGINPALVNGVYFAQNECKNFEQFFIEDKSFLYTSDGILVKVPNELLSQKTDLSKQLDKINLSNHKVDIKFYNKVLSSKQIYALIATCIFFALINVIKIVDYKNSTEKIDEKIASLKANSSLPESILQTNSIIKKYKKIATKELKKREAFEYIVKNKEFKLSSLELKKDVLNLDFKNTNKSKAEKYILKKYKIISSKQTNEKLNIKVQL